jgi:hypothetical protein
MKKKLIYLLISLMFTLNIGAQNQQKFSPEKFDAELHEFITSQAKLTPQEATKFFPIYKEMQGKQRAIYEKQRILGMQRPHDESSCLKAIRERDAIDLELKRIQQCYHEKFLEIMPASKLYEVLQAEDRFHRRMLRRFNRPNTQMPQMNQQNQGNQNQQWRWPGGGNRQGNQK